MSTEQVPNFCSEPESPEGIMSPIDIAQTCRFNLKHNKPYLIYFINAFEPRFLTSIFKKFEKTFERLPANISIT